VALARHHGLGAVWILDGLEVTIVGTIGGIFFFASAGPSAA